jgi:starch phosphorylase
VRRSERRISFSSGDRRRGASHEGARLPAADVYAADTQIRDAVDILTTGILSRGDRDLFRPLVEALLDRDEYMLLADYQSYLECQETVSRRWADAEHWTRASILNVARSARFSSDRAIREYCEDIWAVSPVPVTSSAADPCT